VSGRSVLMFLILVYAVIASVAVTIGTYL